MVSLRSIPISESLFVKIKLKKSFAKGVMLIMVLKHLYFLVHTETRY